MPTTVSLLSTVNIVDIMGVVLYVPMAYTWRYGFLGTKSLPKK